MIREILSSAPKKKNYRGRYRVLEESPSDPEISVHVNYAPSLNSSWGFQRMAPSQVQIAGIRDENTTTIKLYLTVGSFSLKSGPLKSSVH